MTRTVLFAEVPWFYASVGRADDPSLAERPVIVGGDPRKRGLVQAATAEALEAGVSVDMPVIEALKLCPRARAVRTDMARYRAVSRQLFAALRRGFDRLEPFGLGAAYFDVSAAADPPEEVGERLAGLVRDELGLPLRIGIASCKFLARLAAEEVGESGVRRIPPGGEAAFLHPLPVTRLEGVGQRTAAILEELGARTVGEVVALGRGPLEEALGTHGLRIHAYAIGADDGPVRGVRHPKSLSREATVRGDLLDRVVLVEHLQELAQQLGVELRLQGLSAGKITLKVCYADQVRTTRSRTLTTPLSSAAAVHAVATDLLGRTQVGSRPVRGLGIQLGGLSPADQTDRQLELFPPNR